MKRNASLLLIVFLLLLVPALLSAQDTPQNYDASLLFAKGFDLFKRGLYAESAEAFGAVAEGRENEAVGIEAAYFEVIARIDSGDLAKAEALADAFLARNAGSDHAVDLLYQRGRIAFLSADYEAAIARFTDFAATQAGSELVSSALFWRAESEYLLGRTRNAYEELVSLLKLYPATPKRDLAEWRLEAIGLESRAGALRRTLDFEEEQGFERLEDRGLSDARKERELEREHLLVSSLRSLYGFEGGYWRMPLYAERTIVEVAPPVPAGPDPAIAAAQAQASAAALATAQAALELAKANRLKELLAAKNATLELLAQRLLAFAEELAK
jgi:outer membrane protein assembly factor BamD (BamD/ComL family)